MVAEKKNCRGIIDLGIFAHKMLKEDGRHWRHIFVAETQIGAGKSRIRRLYISNALLILWIEHVPGKDFLRNRHWALGGSDGRQKTFLLHTRHVERKQAAILDYLPSNVVFSFSEFTQWNLIAGTHLVDQAEVR